MHSIWVLLSSMFNYLCTLRPSSRLQCTRRQLLDTYQLLGTAAMSYFAHSSLHTAMHSVPNVGHCNFGPCTLQYLATFNFSIWLLLSSVSGYFQSNVPPLLPPDLAHCSSLSNGYYLPTHSLHFMLQKKVSISSQTRVDKNV